MDEKLKDLKMSIISYVESLVGKRLAKKNIRVFIVRIIGTTYYIV